MNSIIEKLQSRIDGLQELVDQHCLDRYNYVVTTMKHTAFYVVSATEGGNIKLSADPLEMVLLTEQCAGNISANFKCSNGNGAITLCSVRAKTYYQWQLEEAKELMSILKRHSEILK